MTIGIQIHIGSLHGVQNPIFDYTNRLSNKPNKAIWTSTWRDGTCAWTEWCEEEYFDVPDVWKGVLLQPNEDAKIYIIDSKSDLDFLIEMFGREQHWFLKADLDFKLIANHYDAIHLTEKGQWETRWHGLNGWDCESTCWLKPAYKILEEVQFPANKERSI